MHEQRRSIHLFTAATMVVSALASGCQQQSAVLLGKRIPSLPTSQTIGPDGRLAPSAITAAMIAFGDSIFHGRAAGGTCATCHGPEGMGGSEAPNLRNDIWLNGDGSYDWIVHVVRNGVAPPRVYPVAMPPEGGGSLTVDEERAVAAYVYSLRSRDRPDSASGQ